jgi:hypothetical protein
VKEEEAQVGVRVKVSERHGRHDLAGQKGTIVRTYRSPPKTGLHVRLDDGRWQLLWPHDLEPLRGDSETEHGGR